MFKTLVRVARCAGKTHPCPHSVPERINTGSARAETAIRPKQTAAHAITLINLFSLRKIELS